MENSAILTVKSVTKYYGNICALDNLSLELKGAINGLVGPNGSGKSTLINIITGMIKPTNGEVTILDRNPFKHDNILKDVGFLPENANYHLNMTVNTYINHVQRIKGKIDTNTDKMLSFLEVPKNRVIGGLSAGMYQKFGLVLALLDSPRFIILDEPTANLDPISRKNIQDLILDYNQDNDTAFLISTHILSELEAIADDLIIINDGKLLTQGNPAKLRKSWKNNNEIQVMVDDSTKLSRVIESDPNLTIVAKFGDHFKLKFENSTAQIDNVFYFLNLVKKHHIELIEIKVGSTLEEIFRRITEHE